jgi:hypothetical protein
MPDPIPPDPAATESVGQAEQPDPRDAELRRRAGVRVLVVIGVTLAVLMVVFGQATAKSYDEFEAYKRATLDDPANPPAWETEALTVEQCVDEVLEWVEACPGVSSWCESTLPDVTNTCLQSQDRSAYCEQVGDAVLSTRFGFEECSARYDQIEGRYTRRYAKKHCSLIFRVIAGHCQASSR